jgi:hypothetical protein
MTTTLFNLAAMLKMLTADYCGTGRSYTVDGQPLKYGDSNHWCSQPPIIPSAVCSIEALWAEKGAVCVDTPRRVDRRTFHASTVPIHYRHYSDCRGVLGRAAC